MSAAEKIETEAIKETALQAVRRELKSAFIQRDTEIDLMFTALYAGEHALLLGKPGTGKTALAETFASAIGLKSWSYLMTKMTTDSEVFGGPDIKKLTEEGIVKRVTTGKLPEAEFAVLDEIFKSNSPILNALLTMLNERKFDNPDRQDVPLKMAVGLSNEMPDGGAEGALHALFDRFVLRTWVERIKGKAGRKALLKIKGGVSITATATASDVEIARRSASQVEVDEKVLDTMLEIADALDEKSIYVSDRRLRKALKVVKAAAAIEGRTSVEMKDLWVLRHVLWNDESEIVDVDKIVTKASDPDLNEARKILGIAKKFKQEAIELHEKESVSLEGRELYAKVSSFIISKMVEVQSCCMDISKLSQTDKVKLCLEQAKEWAAELKQLNDKLCSQGFSF